MDGNMKSRLLIGSSRAPAVIARPMGFADELRYEDRLTLRAVARKALAHYFRGHPTNAQLDGLIDALGPVAQQKMIKAKIDADGSL